MRETGPGLGRRRAVDARDRHYPMESVLREARLPRTFRYWNGNRWTGDQGGTSQCVVYAWAHCVERPDISVTPWHSKGGHVLAAGSWWFAGTRPLIDLDAAYTWAQANDEWEGSDYDGTSVRAGAKYLHHNGLIGGYTWAYSATTIAQAVLTIGPVVVGTSWTMDMFIPDRLGYITPTGEDMGGHAYLIDGVNMQHKTFRIKNSWGNKWGRFGFAYLTFDDLDELLSNYGEACLPVFNNGRTP